MGITNMGDTQELSGTATNLDDGTYKDQVSGGTITVSGGKITSGSAPGGKISVFFTDNSGSVSATPGDSSFKTDTTTAVSYTHLDVYKRQISRRCMSPKILQCMKDWTLTPLSIEWLD